MTEHFHGHSAACCTIPPVSHDYTPKGTYETIHGIRTYRTGPSDAKRAILLVFDIFGFQPQTLQGADILATANGNKYQVFVPDFFDGKPVPLDVFPPDTKEKQETLGKFFETTGNPGTAVGKVPQIVDAVEKAQPGVIDKWGIVGFCWGGKVTTLSSTKGTKFAAAASAHPAMVDPKDAPGVSVPIILLPSKDESMDDVNAFAKDLTVDHVVEHYPDQIHGWMGARGDLKDQNVAKNYQKGYQSILTFFHKHL